MRKPPYEVYAEQLYRLHHGRALYEPDPAGEYDKVRVGDVGHVHLGKFRRPFNVFYAEGHPINARGVPADFEPLPEVFRNDVNVRAALPPGVMRTRKIKQTGTEISGGGSAAVVKAGIEIRFECACDVGAALILNRPAYREDAGSERPLKDCFIANYHSWHDFAVNVVGRDIRIDDLVLVTGCDLTMEWATMVLEEQYSSTTIRFLVGGGSVAGASLAFWGEWVSSEEIPLRCGPSSSPPTSPNSLYTLGNPTPDITFGDIHYQETPPSFNQCVFIRGYRLRERLFLIPKLRAAALAEPKTDDHPPDPYAQACPVESKRDGQGDDLAPLEEGAVGKKVDVYDMVAYHIFQNNPTVDIAVICDEDISAHIDGIICERSMLEAGDEVFSHGDNFAEVEISRYGTTIVGQLRHVYDENDDTGWPSYSDTSIDGETDDAPLGSTSTSVRGEVGRHPTGLRNFPEEAHRKGISFDDRRNVRACLHCVQNWRICTGGYPCDGCWPIGGQGCTPINENTMKNLPSSNASKPTARYKEGYSVSTIRSNQHMYETGASASTEPYTGTEISHNIYGNRYT